MKIPIPKIIFGAPIAGARERAKEMYENKTPTGGEDQPPQEGFIYVPKIQLYVAKQKELFGKNWDEQREILHERKDRMPTPLEYVAFLNELRKLNTDESREILDEIYAVRSPWRSEYLDAKFKVTKKKVITMSYYTFEGDKIVQKSVDLQNILRENKTPGISLDSWLQDNEYGIPKSSIASGDLCYWAPQNGRVAGFGADSGGAGFGCGGVPSSRVASLGVRAVRRFGVEDADGINSKGGNSK